MKAVVALLLGTFALAAQAEQQVQPESVAEATSFSRVSQAGPAQLPDVNEQEGADSLMPAFASEPQTQALMLGGVLAMGFMVRRRREN